MRKEKVLALAKGFRGKRKNCIHVARGAVDKKLQYAYIGRKLKKRDARSLWIQQMNAATREHGVPYSRFIAMLNNGGIELNRKVLADMAATEPFSFAAVMHAAKVTSGHPRC